MTFIYNIVLKGILLSQLDTPSQHKLLLMPPRQEFLRGTSVLCPLIWFTTVYFYNMNTNIWIEDAEAIQNIPLSLLEHRCEGDNAIIPAPPFLVGNGDATTLVRRLHPPHCCLGLPAGRVLVGHWSPRSSAPFSAASPRAPDLYPPIRCDIGRSYCCTAASYVQCERHCHHGSLAAPRDFAIFSQSTPV